MNQRKRVAFLLQSLDFGGIERVVINLLKSLVKHDQISLDLVLGEAIGVSLKQVPAGIRIIDLKTKVEGRTKSLIKLVPAISRYLKEEKPDILLAHLPVGNVFAIISKIVAGIPVNLILVEHIGLIGDVLSIEHKNKSQLLPTLLPLLMRFFYPKANSIVAVSQGLANDLETGLNLKKGTIKVIYNPVVDEELLQASLAPINHPWFAPNQPPVFLGVGRLTSQKDFATLLQAFAQVRQNREAKLLILGEGNLRDNLEKLVRDLNLENDVLMPGFVDNPGAYMRQAKVFVLSSVLEGLPVVMIEAIACGCQVVSTDCPNGPREILAHGKYGWLVPVKDVILLSKAMEEALDFPLDANLLETRSKIFSVEESVNQYLELMGFN